MVAFGAATMQANSRKSKNHRESFAFPSSHSSEVIYGMHS
jgi:hypothetical protein